MTLQELRTLLEDAADLIDEGAEVTILRGAIHTPIYRMHLKLPEEEIYLDCNED